MQEGDIKEQSSIRKVIASVLSKMENKFYYFTKEDNDIVKKDIPFFYSITTSSQRYINKHYFRDPEEAGEPINNIAALPQPRGVLVSNDIQINNSQRTNPYVRGNYQKLIDGNIEMVSSELRFVPITMPMTLSISTSNINQLMTIFESMAKIPDTIIPFYYHENGIQVGGLITFPESLQKDISSEWNYATDKSLVHEMNIDIVSSIVDYDEFTRRHLNSRMKEINLEFKRPKLGQIKPSDDVHGTDSPFGHK